LPVNFFGLFSIFVPPMKIAPNKAKAAMTLS